MDTEVLEVRKLTFGLLSAEEIRAMSAFEVKESKVAASNLYNTVYDPRSGPLKNGTCETCGENHINCPGHFGHIELNTPIIHPMFLNHVVNLLKVFCSECFNCILSKDHLELYGIMNLNTEQRFETILERIKKMTECTNCGAVKDDYKYVPSDPEYHSIYRISSDKNEPNVKFSVEAIMTTFENLNTDVVQLLGITEPKRFILTTFPVIPICCRPYVISDGNICDDDLTTQLIEIVKNNNLIVNHTTSRGVMVQGNHNNSSEPKALSKNVKVVNNLKFRILTYCNNSQGDATHATTGRPIKGIKERITGKDGRIRANLLGKRSEQSGRTVVGPDPNLCFDEVGVPEWMAKILTIPERVNMYNIDSLEAMVNNGQANYIHSDGPLNFDDDQIEVKSGVRVKINIQTAIDHKGTILKHGDVILRPKGSVKDSIFLYHNGPKQKVTRLIMDPNKQHDGKEYYTITIHNPNAFVLDKEDRLIRDGIELPVTLPRRRRIRLRYGQVVDRQLMDGDVVMFNRQPTLHKMSMMAHRVKVVPYKSFRMSLATTKPYNADFDGDEMNIHVPQSLEARSELLNLSTPKHCLISGQAGKPIITIVQDVLLGAYLMSKENVDQRTLTRHQFSDIVMVLLNYKRTPHMDLNYYLNRHEQIRTILIKLGYKGEVFNGKAMLSLLLPHDFFMDKDDLKIYRGVIHYGNLSKKYLSSTESSLIKLLSTEYGMDTCATFIDLLQFMVNQWLLIEGFSIHAGDCLKEKDLGGMVEKYLMQAETIKHTTYHPSIRESKIIATLSNAKDVGMKIAKDSLRDSNNFIKTIESGSKGDYFNIAQITGLLGQQNVQSERIPKVLNNGRRTLPHYDMDEDKLTLTQQYESRGFVTSSFVQGMNPKEFFFHAMAGRKGVCDTAMSTADCGYTMRRIIKCMENVKVEYDYTVCGGNRMYQYISGGLGYDPSKTVKVGGKAQVCNVSRLVDKLNFNFENNGS